MMLCVMIFTVILALIWNSSANSFDIIASLSGEQQGAQSDVQEPLIDDRNLQIFTPYYIDGEPSADLNAAAWKQYFELFKYNGDRPLNFLEIGAYEGRSTRWLLMNILTHKDSRITCIDTWNGSVEHTANQKDGLFDRFVHNTSPYKHKLKTIRMESGKALKLPEVLSEVYDFIYIDASHLARNALEDSVLAWPLLRTYGFLIFDDYIYPGMLS